MANYVTMGSAKQSDDNMDDDDDKDDTKRKSRNLSEKKRRDQFNMLVNELSSMVTTNNRKMDKSTVLKSTILFLKNHNEIAVRSRIHEIQEDWKPSFLSNEEFTHLILEAVDGFIIVFSTNGQIYYASESVTSLLGYLPSELVNSTIYEIAYQDDQSYLYNVLLNPGDSTNQRGVKEENQVSFTCHIKRGGLDYREEDTYELVQFIGHFRSNIDVETLIPNNLIGKNVANDTKLVFVGTGRLQTPQLIRDMSFVDSTKSEFTSRHSLEWKFLFLDHRAPPIIGYLPFEVLGTSGYDYYHVDDLDNVVKCHESLMQKGEGTSCYYRFLTKGQQWIWLQTRFYIDYNQWNSKPEFIVCTHNVVSYKDVITQLKKNINDCDDDRNSSVDKNTSKVHQFKPPTAVPAAKTAAGQLRSTAWSPKSSKPSKPVVAGSKIVCHGFDATSISTGADSPRNSISTINNSKLRASVTSPSEFTPQLEDNTKRRRQPEVEHSSRINYAQPRMSVAPVNFPAPVSSAVPISLLPNQHNIVMTTAQNQIQDELQRKHEELQQLIVHQQEELRRVSEQLFIARYGILSPLINVTLPCNINSSQPTQCCISPNVNMTNSQVSTDADQQELSVPSVSANFPMPLMPMETFRQPTSSLVESDNAPEMIPQQHHRIQQNDQHSHNTQHLSPATHQEDHHRMMSFEICPQNEVIYSNVDTVARVQQRQNRN